ncbi:MAG: ATP-binding protein [[Clostridium] symbiosum]
MDEICTFSSDRTKATYKFRCSDTGRGMSKDFISHVFEPFAQEDSCARTNYMGTGLGMAIAKQFTEMMEGNIAVESELDVGTTFTVTIPFELDSNYKEAYALENVDFSKSLSGLKVLLVEDNELNMEIAKFILENAELESITMRKEVRD